MEITGDFAVTPLKIFSFYRNFNKFKNNLFLQNAFLQIVCKYKLRK